LNFAANPGEALSNVTSSSAVVRSRKPSPPNRHIVAAPGLITPEREQLACRAEEKEKENTRGKS